MAPAKGTSMYYVSKKGGGRGSAKCLLLLTWGEGGLRGHAYVIVFWKKIFALNRKITKKSCKTTKQLFANNLDSGIMKFSSQSTLLLLNLGLFTKETFSSLEFIFKRNSYVLITCPIMYIDAFEQKKKEFKKF